MRALYLSLVALSAIYATPTLRANCLPQKPESGIRMVPKAESDALARSTFFKAKSRFLAGFPKGYKLFVAGSDDFLFHVDTIENGTVWGHWPQDVDPPTYEITQKRFSTTEEEITDWKIVRPNGASEGNFQPSSGPWFFTSQRSATGATCEKAQLALDSVTESDAINICAARDSSRPCGRCQGVWNTYVGPEVRGDRNGDDDLLRTDALDLRREPACRWNAKSQLFETEGFRVFACCL